MSKDNKLNVSFFENEDFFAEEICNPSFTPAKQFVLYNKADDSNKIVEDFEVTLEGKSQKIAPLDLDLIDKGIVLLPSIIDNKTTDEHLDQKILTFIRHWVDVEKFSEQLSLHYIKMSWIHDRLSIVPYLRALGDYGSGKTRFIQTIGSLCYKPMFLAGATSDAYLFRVIELFKGTMVLNEFERVNTDLSAQIVNILNNGYEKGMGVGRIEGDKTKTPAVYDVFCPKIISAREPFKDLALESRIITIRLYPTVRKDIPVAVDSSFWKEAAEIRNALLAYRLNFITEQTRNPAQEPPSGDESSTAVLAGLPLDKAKEQVLYELEPRLRQTLLPLICVVPEDKVGQFANFAKEYQQEAIEDRGLELDGIVARCLFVSLEETSEVAVRELRGKVNDELDDDKFKITPQKLGKILKSWGLKTTPVGHEKILYIVNSEAVFRRLRSRFGIPSAPQQSTADTADPQPSSNMIDKTGEVEEENQDDNKKGDEQDGRGLI